MTNIQVNIESAPAVRNPNCSPFVLVDILASVYSEALLCVSLCIYLYTLYIPHCFLCLQPSQRCRGLLIPYRIFSLSSLLCTRQAIQVVLGVGRGVLPSAPPLQT